MASRSSIACLLCHRAIVVNVTRRGMSAAAQSQPLSSDFLKGEPHRKHPGVTNMKTLRLPDELQTAARSIIHRAQIKRLTERTHSLTNFLWSRKRNTDDVTLRKRGMKLERELWERAKDSDVDEELLEDRIRRKVLSELKRTTYHWTPMKFDEELGIVFMAARLAGGYAAVRRAMNEIKKRVPSFAPQTLLDFGSGLGTVAWASHSCWGDSLKEMVCVDSSGPMNVLAERLLKGDDDRNEPHFKHVYFRQFLPVSPKVQFDLVTAAFTLSELPNTKEREEAVMTLWRKTSSYLVLVENGTKEGHQMLMEARDTLLKNQEKNALDPRPASVFAPCPHEQMCPKLSKKTTEPCNFQQLYQPLPLPKHNDQQTEKFSYLIMGRTEPVQTGSEGVTVAIGDKGVEGVREGEEEVDWSRLIAPVLRRTRHVHCRMCCSDGQLRHLVVTARKHTRDVYRCARISDWGDLVPTATRQEEEEEEEEEDQPH